MAYAKAQNTSGKGEAGGEASAGAVNVTVNTGGTSNVTGQVNVQLFTADANGHVGTGGVGAGVNARVTEWGGDLSFKVAGDTVTLKGTVSAIGLGANAHVDWRHGFSAGAGIIAVAVGASLNVSVRPTTGSH